MPSGDDGNGVGNAVNHKEAAWQGPRLVPSQSTPAKGAPYGFSQIGVHDLVPKLGYREYWYPAIEAKKVGRRSFLAFGRRKPVAVKMLGDELVLFPGKDGKITAITNRCPHRGALFTPNGRCEFEGTITCPYHGYTYDETGTCVAALTEGPDSGLVGKLRARRYPTTIVRGIVFVWMGQTEPVPIEEDVPEEFFDPAYVMESYSNEWPMNWSLSVENSGDHHTPIVHRFRMAKILDLSAFRKIPAYWQGQKIIEQTDRSVTFQPAGRAPQQAFYPGLGKKWPQHVWFRFLNQRKVKPKRASKRPPGFEHRLPSIAMVHFSLGYMYLRWATPVDENRCVQFIFSTARATTWRTRLYWKLYLRFWFRLLIIKTGNELEDLPVQRSDRLDPTAPNKLGANDVQIIIWRRRLPLTSRDNVRVWKKGLQITKEQDAEAQAYEATEKNVDLINKK